VQQKNAQLLMVLHPVPIVTVMRDRHDLNAPTPISQSCGTTTCLSAASESVEADLGAAFDVFGDLDTR
jgi:hypothetical protein